MASSLRKQMAAAEGLVRQTRGKMHIGDALKKIQKLDRENDERRKKKAAAKAAKKLRNL